MKVGIFGGTFNPPHIGHEKAAQAAFDQLGLDCLLIVPVGIPPHKSMPSKSPSAKTRLIMTQNAFCDLPDTTVSDFEAKTPTPSYTINTIRAIKKIYPDAKLFLLMGTDMFLSIESWKEHSALLTMITPAVFSRSESDLENISEYSAHIKSTYDICTEIIQNTIVQVSSSELRNLLPKREGTGYIKDTNYSYIIRCRLYGAKPNWDWLRAQAYSMLDKQRVPHVEACEAEALSLAERWNVNPDDAREAAILHDITKKLDVGEHVRILQEHGTHVRSIKKNEEKLLHAKTGAFLVQELFGASDEVEDAIRWHTTGKAGMSELAKVLYLADYIESTRSFPGIEQLRMLAYENIDLAMKLGLEMTVSDLTKRDITPDKDTLDAIRYFS
ncbi:MAG: nicotinate (nicotinamide) nucleotide adenylyltransferase [Oscillospiraceae bacterium]|nr:nicotinate (nicotinamide) nucleotide adenylyltransferase [Oscillospiraceae bacterium]